MAARFNPAPGWPPVPDGWVPPPGWTHPPDWPSAPPGWPFWVQEPDGAAVVGPPSVGRAWWRRKRVLVPAGVVLLLSATGVAGADEPGPAEVAAPPATAAPDDDATAEASAAAVADEEAAAAQASTEAQDAAAAAAAAEEAAAEVAAVEAAAERAAAERAAAEQAAAERASAEQAAAEQAAAEAARVAEAEAAEAAEAEAASVWVVTNIVDGDTVDVERDGVTERVRVNGMDTPEQGECGFEESSTAMGAVVGGQEVLLRVQARDERDRYGRLIAYVDTLDGVDAGLVLIQDGMAVARYDSRDGYGAHPREDAYVAADAASPVAYACDDPAPAPVAPAPVPVAPEAPAVAAYANCDAVRAAGADPIREGDPGWAQKFDRDGDGVGCE